MPAAKTKFGLLLFLAQWVVYSEAWFWSWSGTTTRIPQTLEFEGSGSPTGSGELPSESTTKAEGDMVYEGHRTPSIKQTSVATTEDPQMSTVTPTTLRQTDDASESVTAGISPQSISGNGTSTLAVLGSGASDHSRIIKNVSKVESESKSALELDSNHGGFSSSGLLPDEESKANLGFVDGEVNYVNRRGIGNESSAASHDKKLGSRLLERAYTVGSGVDDGEDLVGAQSEQIVKSNVSNKQNALNENSHKVQKYLLKLILGSGDQHMIAKSKGVQDLAAPHQNNSVLQSRNAHRILSTTETSVMTPKQFFSQTKTHIEKPKTKAATIATQPHSGRTLDATVLLEGKQETVKAAETGEGTRARTENSTNDSKSCLMLDTALPFCSSKFGETFAVPNYFNHSSVEEVRTLLKEWSWLLQSHCHHSLEWFFCLLLVPKCGPLTPTLPCRSFCEVLLDSCWTLLEGQHLPVECHTLPDEDHGYQCLSVCNQKGNLWFRMDLTVYFEPVVKPPPHSRPLLNAVNVKQIINVIQNNHLWDKMTPG